MDTGRQARLILCKSPKNIRKMEAIQPCVALAAGAVSFVAQAIQGNAKTDKKKAHKTLFFTIFDRGKCI
jgi:hypothetical protein